MSLSPVEQIKARLSITDVVGSYVQLKQAGAGFKARCPFHNEKTPSFVVSPDRGTFHCFGCGKGGDMFDFVQEMDGVDFRGALKILADRAGVELVSRKGGGERKDERDALYDILEDATMWFEAQLKERRDACAYLRERGLTGETAKQFRIGYAPNEWRALSDWLKGKGYPEGVLEKAGLIARSPRGYYDRFRGRIIFPITDAAGRVVAYSGRVFEEAYRERGMDIPPAKYINSPETPLYHKSHSMYGFDRAKQAIRTERVCVVVEGQMDTVLSHQAGVRHTVAVSGTALTEEHLGRIRPLADTVIFAFDADSAGSRASERGAQLALEKGFEVRIAELPGGYDPADMVKRDPGTWRKVIAEARCLIDYLFEMILARQNDPRRRRLEVERQVLPYVARLESAMERAHYIAHISQTLGVQESAVWDAAMKYPAGTPANSAPSDVARSRVEDRMTLLRRECAAVASWLRGTEGSATEAEALTRRFEEITGDALQDEYARHDAGVMERTVLDLQTRFSDENTLRAYVEELLIRLEHEMIVSRMRNVSVELRAHSDGSEAHLRLVREHVELAKRLEELRSALGL